MKKLWNNPKWRISLIAAVVVLLIIVGVVRRHGPDPVEVSTVTVKPTSLIVKLPENGTLQRPQTATIAAAVGANIVAIYARESQLVRQGDILMKLDDRQISTSVASDRASAAQALASLSSGQARLQADINAKREGQISGGLSGSSLGLSGSWQLVQAEQSLTSARLTLRTAKDSYDADVALYKINGLPLQQLNRDKAAYDQAVASLFAAQSQYDLLKQQLRETGGQLASQIAADRVSVESAQAQLDSANAALAFHSANLADTEVRAPFDGVVQQLGTLPSNTAVPLASGDAVTLGQILFTIAGSGPMVVKAQVDEQDIINVKLGQRALVTGEDFPGRTLEGRVQNIAAVVVQSTTAGNSAKNVETTIALQKDYPFLHAGMSCDVDIITGETDHAIVVPLAAVVDDVSKRYVFIIRQNRAARVEVRKGMASDTDVVITKGLKDGDIVATTNVKDLKDGAPVKVKTEIAPLPSSSSTP